MKIPIESFNRIKSVIHPNIRNNNDWLYWKDLKDININKLPYKIYLTRYGGSNYGINRLITIKNPNQWFDWDKKQFFHKRNWSFGQYLIKNTVINLCNRKFQ